MNNTLSLIVAMADNGVIGRDNRLPWHLPADLAFFKRTTLDKSVIMGRRTFESIGRPLPRRHMIIITRQTRWRADGCTVVHSLDEAIGAAGNGDEIMIIGGAQVFKEALPRADRVYLTQVHATVPGDTFFPRLPPGQWRETWREDHEPDERNALPYSFILLERQAPGG